MEKVSIISLILSTISLGIAIYSVSLSRRTYRLQSARPHSKKIATEFEDWLLQVRHFVLHPARLPVNEHTLKSHELKELLYPQQHFEKGYPEIFKKYKEWKESANVFNNRLKDFIEELKIKMKKDLGLPSPHETHYDSPYVDYQRIISHSFAKILTGQPENLFEFRTPNGLINLENLQEYRNQVKLSWGGGILVKGDAILCRRTAEFINEFIYNLSNSPQVVQVFHKESERLLIEWNHIAEEIKTKIIDKAKYGEIIKGKCAACC